MIGDFFIWCAGSDTNVLSKCEDSVRIKHIGLGTLVMIPAFLGFVSMTYALSTIDNIHNQPYVYFGGGLSWGLIVFAFDRYIVSTHRKHPEHSEELGNITFYIRILFAVVLGIVVSHPFVLLYFDGSIHQKIVQDRDQQIRTEETVFLNDRKVNSHNLDKYYDQRGCLLQVLLAEQSGNKLVLKCGSSSGIPNVNGTFPRTLKIQAEINKLDRQITQESTQVANRNLRMETLKNTSQKNVEDHTSFDYLSREIALDELKSKNPIIATTQIFLMLAFMLVDILPLMFKTFSSFSMYDKILIDDIQILKSINIESRKNSVQRFYNRISNEYMAKKRLTDEFNYKEYVDGLTKKYNLARNIFHGISLGVLITTGLYFCGNINISSNALFSLSTAFAILVSLLANVITELVKYVNERYHNEA